MSLIQRPASLADSLNNPTSKECHVAKKNMSGRKPGGAAGIAVIEDAPDSTPTPEAVVRAAPVAETPPAKAKGQAKAKDEQPSSGNFGIGEIRKAAAFANSVGGLDKAIALLQILKVAKEVQ